MAARQLLARHGGDGPRVFVTGVGAHQRPQVRHRLTLGFRQEPIEQAFEVPLVRRIEHAGNGRRPDV